MTKEDVLRGKCHEIQGNVKKTWGRITDDEVILIDGERIRPFY